MTRQHQAALLCAIVAVIFVLLQIVLRIQTGTAGVFVMGVAGGLLVAHRLAEPVTAPPAA